MIGDVIRLNCAMEKRTKCRRFFCWRYILEQTSKDNGGLCARCFKRKDPNTWNRFDPNNTWKRVDPNTRYENELKIPATDLTDRQKRRQLQGSITTGNESRIDELLASDKSFLVKPTSKFKTWLGEAISDNCSISILEKLIAAGCDPNSRSKSPDQTCPLEIAVSKNRIDVMEWLISRGADPKLGRPAVGAVHYEKPPEMQLKMLGILLDAGADVNRSFALHGDENDRFTVLDWAILYGVSPVVIEYLERYGAKREFSSERIAEMKRDLKPRGIVP